MEFNFYEKCAWMAGFISFNGWRQKYVQLEWLFVVGQRHFIFIFVLNGKYVGIFGIENGDKPDEMKILTLDSFEFENIFNKKKLIKETYFHVQFLWNAKNFHKIGIYNFNFFVNQMV